MYLCKKQFLHEVLSETMRNETSFRQKSYQHATFLELKRKFSQNPANICSVLCLNVLNSMFSLRYYNFCFDSSEASFSGHFARTNVEHWDQTTRSMTSRFTKCLFKLISVRAKTSTYIYSIYICTCVCMYVNEKF